MTEHAGSPYRVALVQMACGPVPEENVARAADRVAEAARAGAQLVCLPELFESQYFCQREDHALFALAEPIPGPTTERLAAVAREHRVAVVVPLFERRAPGLYHNSAVVLERDGSIAGRYRKMHIPDDPLYYEKFYFAPGDLGFPAFPTSVGRLAVLICWDQWYPEAARLAALAGAELLVYPTAIGWHPEERAEHGPAQYEAWQTIQRAHAIANGVYVAVPNRVGHENGDVRGDRVDGPGIDFWGGSFVADPFGRILVQGGPDREELLYATIDPAAIATTRQHWPFLRDRRIDAYGPLTERFRDRP
ncbi:MAG TPA: carbon-nitrogen hydrolase [Thermoplasmata archaeon]|nr:carbon-nitrogen hydrolase [Thermoplasmata archaeon]